MKKHFMLVTKKSDHPTGHPTDLPIGWQMPEQRLLAFAWTTNPACSVGVLVMTTVTVIVIVIAILIMTVVIVIGTVWSSNGWPMVGQWMSNGWPMVGEWLANGWPMF